MREGGTVEDRVTRRGTALVRGGHVCHVGRVTEGGQGLAEQAGPRGGVSAAGVSVGQSVPGGACNNIIIDMTL